MSLLLQPAPVLEEAQELLTTALQKVFPGVIHAIPAPCGGQAYERVILQQEESLALMAARWRQGGESAWHGHSDSAALYRVLRGTIREERFIPEGDSYRYETELLEVGDSSYLPPGSYHRVEALTEACTLHGYTPLPTDAREEVEATLMQELQAIKRRTLAAVQAKPYQEKETFAATYVPVWAEREQAAVKGNQTRLPRETLDEIRSSGILAAPLPTDLGGWGWSLGETVQFIRWLAQRAPATALALAMPLGNAATTRLPAEAVPDPMRSELRSHQEWMAEQILQGKILAVANSEPGAGGDLANTKTTARREGAGYVLTGRKSFATLGPDADYFLCAARRLEDGTMNGVVDGFFVARDAPGLTLEDNWNPVGMKPTASVGLTLEKAPASAILGYPGCLEGVNARHWSTLLFAAVCLGIGEGALREGVATAGEAMWAKAKLAEYALQLDAAAGFLEALTVEETWPCPAALQERARRAKTYAAKVAVEAATHVAMISGGRAYVPNHPAFRLLCDALAGPLIRPPLPQAMEAIIKQMFPGKTASPLKMAA